LTAFESNLQNLYGKEGKRWLDGLPNRVDELSITYRLTNLKPFQNLSYNYVAHGHQGDRPVVLKIGFDKAAIHKEVEALCCFKDFGVVELIVSGDDFLLMERALSGVSLKTYFPEFDDKAINHTAAVIKRLHQACIPTQHTFPHIKDWLSTLDSDLDIPTDYLKNTRKIRDHLLETSRGDVLLHGDLHHENILQMSDGWVAIDPKGVLGETLFDVAAFIRNPIQEILLNPI
jgi:streptomycin 6-kinase